VKIGYRNVNFSEDKCQIVELYKTVGWSAYIDDELELLGGIRNSLQCTLAIDGDRIIGLIRIVGDAKTIVYIQDLLVHTDYQRNGIGKKLIDRVLAEYNSVRQIILLCDDTAELNSFYNAVGFKEVNEHKLKSFIRLRKNSDG